MMDGYKTYAGLGLAVVGAVLVYLGYADAGFSLIGLGVAGAGYGRFSASQRSKDGKVV